MFRKKMSKRRSVRSFKGGNKVHLKNFKATPHRGGFRL